MVSQKEKKRLQEGSQRRESYNHLHVARVQAALVVQLQELLSTSTTSKTSSSNKNNKSSVAKAVKKLIKDTQYNEPDLKDDIGEDARALALQIYRQCHRPGDALEVLNQGGRDVLANHNSPTALEAKVGLWAAASQEDWEAGLPFALALFAAGDHDCVDEGWSESSVDGGSDDKNTAWLPSRTELQHYAIQTLALTDTNITTATKLWNELLSEQQAIEEEIDRKVLAKASLQALLESHKASGRREEFQRLFQEVTATSSFSLDTSLVDAAFEVAAIQGNIDLMNLALGHQSLDGPSTTQQHWMLETIATHVVQNRSTDMEIAEPLLGLAHSILKALLSQNKKHASMLDLEFVSNVICSLPNTVEGLELALLLHFGPEGGPIRTETDARKPNKNSSNKQSKNKNKKSRGKNKKSQFDAGRAVKAPAIMNSQLLSLNEAARARIFPFLAQWEYGQNNEQMLPKTSIAWAIYNSFLKVDKSSGALLETTREFLRAQSSDFHSWGLYLCYDLLEDHTSFQGVLKESWPSVFNQYYMKTMPWSAYMTVCCLQRLFSIESNEEQIELFANILNNFTRMPLGEDGSTVDVSDLPTLPNEKVDMVMKSAVRWFRDNADTFARTDDGYQMGKLSLEIIAGVRECRGRYAFWNKGRTDNGAKEALQTIMKEMLVLNWFKDDLDLTQMAIVYYRELGRVAQSSSTIQYQDLFFLSTSSSLIERMKRADGYSIHDEFKALVLGDSQAQSSKEKTGGFQEMLKSFARNAALNAVSLLDDELGSADQSIVMVRDVVREMAFVMDQRDGSRLEEIFNNYYKDLFVKGVPGLFIDFELSYQLMSAVENSISFDSLLLDGTRALEIEVVKTGVDLPLLDKSFARRLIKRLGSLRDIRFAVQLADEFKLSKDERLDRYIMILFHLYDLAICFEELESLHEEYLSECNCNTNFVADQVSNLLVTRKTVLGKGNQAKSVAMANDAFKSMGEFVVRVSKIAKTWESPVSEGTMLDRISTIQPLVASAWRFYNNKVAGSSLGRVRNEWLTNEAILPEIRQWIKEEIDDIARRRNSRG